MGNSLKIKVCGMKHADNMASLLELSPDFMGMIFYPKSARNIPKDFALPSNYHNKTNIVGVFVHEAIDTVLNITKKYGINHVQLHGKESPIYCDALKKEGLTVIKVFSINNDFDFSQIKLFENCCDYFLFDTKGKLPGGNGTKFEWKLLIDNHIPKPFFLSGGINEENSEDIKKMALSATNLIGVDINSGFETAPGTKDIKKISTFFKNIRL